MARRIVIIWLLAVLLPFCSAGKSFFPLIPAGESWIKVMGRPVPFRVVAESLPEKLTTLRFTAAVGNMMAQAELGSVSLSGKRYREALEWYGKAAEQGSMHAQHTLGVLYALGNGFVEQSDEAAAVWFEKAAEQGHPYAQNLIAAMYATGKGVPQSIDHAILWYAKAAAQGGDVSDVTVIAQLGLASSYQGEIKFFWYTMAANQGDVSAQTFLGDIYLKEGKEYRHDKDSEASYKKAAMWYQKAAERRGSRFYVPMTKKICALAQRKLGSMYLSGKGVRQSFEKAEMWLKTASADGDAAAPRLLAEMYTSGKGTEQNYEKAAAEFQKAAERGDTIAQRELGGVYCYGLGVRQSFEMAVMWLKKAAAKDDEFAQSLLGMVYLTGDSTMLANLTLAEVWYAKAADNGDEGAKEALARMREDVTINDKFFFPPQNIVVDLAVIRVGSMLLSIVRPTWAKQFRSHSHVHAFASVAIALFAFRAWDPIGDYHEHWVPSSNVGMTSACTILWFHIGLPLLLMSLPGISKVFDISTILMWLPRSPWWLVKNIRLWVERRRRKREKEKAKQKSAAGRDAQAKAKKEKEEAKRMEDEEAARRKEERATIGAVKKARKQEAEAAKKEKEMKQLLGKEGKRREKEGKRREQEAKQVVKQAEKRAEKQAGKVKQEAVHAMDEARRGADQARRRDEAKPSRAASAATLAPGSVSSSARPKSSASAHSSPISSSTQNDLTRNTFRVGSLTVYKSAVLGEGSGGTMVYRGRHADGRAVAVKVMDKAIVPEHRARREMRLLQVGDLLVVGERSGSTYTIYTIHCFAHFPTHICLPYTSCHHT
jgi:TPR repeat protein